MRIVNVTLLFCGQGLTNVGEEAWMGCAALGVIPACLIKAELPVDSEARQGVPSCAQFYADAAPQNRKTMPVVKRTGVPLDGDWMGALKRSTWTRQAKNGAMGTSAPAPSA